MAHRDDSSITAFAAAALCVLILTCGGAALAQTGGTASSTLWTAPARAAQRSNPLAADAASVKTGRKVYDRECQKCHGKAGQGDGPQAKFLDTPPVNLKEQAVATQSDGALFWKISEGRGPMPKATLAEKEIWSVVNYIRTLQRSP